MAAPDQGQAFWFLNTLTITKVIGGDSQGRLSIVDHRGAARVRPPPHIHHHSDEAFFILDGDFAGFGGDRHWAAGLGRMFPSDVGMQMRQTRGQHDGNGMIMWQETRC